MQVTYSPEIYGTLSDFAGTHALENLAYYEYLFVLTLLCDIPGLHLLVLVMHIYDIIHCNILISVCDLPCSFKDLEDEMWSALPPPVPVYSILLISNSKGGAGVRIPPPLGKFSINFT